MMWQLKKSHVFMEGRMLGKGFLVYSVSIASFKFSRILYYVCYFKNNIPFFRII